MGAPRSDRGGVRVWHVIVAALFVWAVWAVSDVAFSPQPVPYTDFLAQLEAGQIAEVRISERAVKWTPAGEAAANAVQPQRLAWRVEDPELAKELRARGVKIIAEPPPTVWQMLIPWLVPLSVLLLVFAFRSGGAPGMRGGLAAVGRSKPRLYMEKDVKVRFSDAAGVPEAKEELQEVLEFLRTPEKFNRLGGKMPRGILLVGPPGTGKTLLARAVAGEAGVPFFSISGSEFVEMFVGVGAARVRDLFEQAREKAPCIIFIDELDALGKVRGMGVSANEEREQTLNQLLVELDGFDPRGGVVLMAATNRPEILDPALLRAGRFDRQVLVDRPDRVGRLEILKVHARAVPMRSEDDLEAVAGMTAGMVGADLANIVNEAALQAVRHDRDQVTRADLDEAVERVVAGLARKSRVLSPAEKRRVAWHEVGHAMVTLALGGDEVRKISILPRGISALGYTIQLPTEDRFLMTQSELENRIAGLLGGRAAEDLVFQELSTGAQDDLRKATLIARGMVRAYGMSDALGPISLADEPQPVFLGRGGICNEDVSEQVSKEVDQEVRRILDAQYQRASWALGARVAAMNAAAKLLLEKETLSGDELEEILRRHPPGEEEEGRRGAAAVPEEVSR